MHGSSAKNALEIGIMGGGISHHLGDRGRKIKTRTHYKNEAGRFPLLLSIEHLELKLEIYNFLDGFMRAVSLPTGTARWWHPMADQS